MDTLNGKLKESTDRLVSQSTSFWSITKGAGEGFVSRTKSAGEQFWTEATQAGGELLSQTKEAQKELVDSLQQEVDAWLEYFRAEVARLRLEGLPKKLSAPVAAESVKVPSVRELELRLLTGLRGGLSDLESKVQQRIEQLDAVALPPPSRTKQNGAPKKAAKTAKASDEDSVAASKSAPLMGYDELTAREVVLKLPKLDKKKVEALLSYEQETKNRATVVSAMRAKLEA